jgi:hypothetical protein
MDMLCACEALFSGQLSGVCWQRNPADGKWQDVTEGSLGQTARFGSVQSVKERLCCTLDENKR